MHIYIYWDDTSQITTVTEAVVYRMDGYSSAEYKNMPITRTNPKPSLPRSDLMRLDA